MQKALNDAAAEPDEPPEDPLLPLLVELLELLLVEPPVLLPAVLEAVELEEVELETVELELEAVELEAVEPEAVEPEELAVPVELVPEVDPVVVVDEVVLLLEVLDPPLLQAARGAMSKNGRTRRIMVVFPSLVDFSTYPAADLPRDNSQRPAPVPSRATIPTASASEGCAAETFKFAIPIANSGL